MTELHIGGDCFIVAGQAVMDCPDITSLVLVHGLVTSPGGGTAPKGAQHWHAWIEDVRTLDVPLADCSGTMAVTMATVIDRSNGRDVEMAQAVYYRIGNVGITRRYTVTEARRLMQLTGNYGPWEAGC